MHEDRELHRRVGALFEAALDLDVDRRDAFLAESCGSDDRLRAAVDRLLANDDDSGPLRNEALDSNRAALDRLLDSDLSDPAPFEPLDDGPERIGPYRILRRIGEGGMGIVYEAEQDSPRRRVALKISRPIHDSDRRLSRFRREGEVLGRLEHPGIARIYQAGTFERGGITQPYFAMEYVEGAPITTYATRQELTLADRLALLTMVCDAVQHAHDNSIIHRDLKPDNVLVRDDGSPVVLDFGVARLSDSSTVLSSLDTMEGEILGTLAYMAPEQLSGDPDRITPRSDVYSLGALAYELLVGRPPHDLGGRALGDAMRMLTELEPVRLGLIDPTLAGDVETIVGTALEMEPARRYGSAAELSADLRAVLHHRPIVAHPPSRLYLARKFARRHKSLVAGSSTAFVAITLALITSLLSLASERDQRELAEVNAERALRGERSAIGHLYRAVQAHLDAGELWPAAQLYAAAERSRYGWEERFLSRVLPHMFPADVSAKGSRWLDDEHIVALARTGGGVRVLAVDDWTEVRRLLPGEPLVRLSVSSDGRLIGERRSPWGMVVVIDPNTGEVLERRPSPFVREPAERYQSTGFDSAGRLITAFISEDQQFMVIDRGAGPPLRLPRTTGSSLPAVVPGSDRFIVWLSGGGLRVHDLDSGAVLGELSGLRPGVGVRHTFHRNGRSLLSSDTDGRLIEIDLERVEVTRRWDDIHCPLFIKLGLSDDGRLLGLGPEGRVDVWDLESKSKLWTGAVNLQPGSGNTVDPSPDGRRAIVGSEDSIGFVLDLDREPVDPAELGTDRDPRATTFTGHEQYVYHLALSPDGRLAASLSVEGGRLLVWDLHRLETVASHVIGRDPSYELQRRSNLIAFDDEGRRLWFTTPEPGGRAGLESWDLLTGTIEQHAVLTEGSPNPQLALLDELLAVLGPGSTGRLGRKAARFSDGTGLAVQQIEGLRILDGERWRTVPEGNAEEGMALSPDESRVAIAGVRATRVMDATGSDELFRVPGLGYAAAWSPDGELFAIAGADGRIRLFDGELLIELYSFPAHGQYVFSLAWTPDSTRLVSTSGDSTVRVWDPRSTEERRADYAPYRRRVEALRGESRAALIDRFERADSTAERGALVRAALTADE